METLIIFGAEYLIYAVVAGSAATLAYSRKTDLLWVLAISLPLVYALARLVGLLFSHTQPFATDGYEPLVPHEVDNSFPSDHTALAGVFATVALYANRWAGAALWVLTLAIGAARMAAGLHWPVDIAASVILALIGVWAVHLSFNALRNT